MGFAGVGGSFGLGGGGVVEVVWGGGVGEGLVRGW